jgi:hypothetical protein
MNILLHIHIFISNPPFPCPPLLPNCPKWTVDLIENGFSTLYNKIKRKNIQ